MENIGADLILVERSIFDSLDVFAGKAEVFENRLVIVLREIWIFFVDFLQFIVISTNITSSRRNFILIPWLRTIKINIKFTSESGSRQTSSISSSPSAAS